MDELMKDLTVMIGGTLVIIDTLNKQHNIFKDVLQYEMKTLSSIVESVNTESDDKLRFYKINVGIAIMYELMTKNEDFKFMFNSAFSDVLNINEDYFKSFKNKDAIYKSVNSIGIYKVMDNIINGVSV